MSRRTGGHRNTLRCPGCHATVAVLRDRRYLRVASSSTALYTASGLTVTCGGCGAARLFADLYLEVGEGMVLEVGAPGVW